MRQKIEERKQQQILEPPPNVAGPLLLAYPFVEHEPDLRDMFEELLLSAMTPNQLVHPSFVDAVKQLTPLEARVLRGLAGKSVEPLLFISLRRKGTISITRQGKFWELPADTDPVSMNDTDRILDNLCRLRLIETNELDSLADKDRYKPLLAQWNANPLVQPSDQEEVDIGQGTYTVTRFGRAFIQACTPQEIPGLVVPKSI